MSAHPFTMSLAPTPTAVVHNGPTCHNCGTPYAGIHSCSIVQLCEAAERADERAAELRRQARAKFDQAVERGETVELHIDRVVFRRNEKGV